MLKLYNTLTRKIEPFKPAQPPKVKMYTCGPSTYQPAHIGNYRTFLFEDIFERYLEYLGFDVERLMTLTDVEDKAIAQAQNEGLTVEEVTAKNEAVFFEDFKRLRIKTPTYTIRASAAVDKAADLTAKLLEGGYAYWHNHEGTKNAYFSPQKFKGFGKISHLDITEWPKKTRRFHKDTYPGTPWNRGDFVLWHGCRQGTVCFDSPIGSGRPAWNIQDAAIVTKHLGFRVDVACGGTDNLVRHHDYTLAVAEAVSGEEFSRFWLHGEHLLVEGKKMSKSKGNVLYVRDLLEKGFSGEQVRFFLIYGHYRQKLNFTFDKLADAAGRLDSFRRMVLDLQDSLATAQVKSAEHLTTQLTASFESCMNNDLDLKAAFDILYNEITKTHIERWTLSSGNLKKVLGDLRRIDTVLQCIFS